MKGEKNISYQVPRVDLENHSIEQEVISMIPGHVAERYQVLPLGQRDNRLKLAMKDPSNIVAIDDIKQMTGLDIDPVIASSDQLIREINRCYSIEGSIQKALDDIDKKVDKGNNPNHEGTTEELLNNSPIVQVVNAIIREAVQQSASDIHLEPLTDSVQIRYRIDGLLYNIYNPPKKTHNLLVSRLKIMSGMDITQRRYPQDGRTTFTEGLQSIDLRIATLPTIFGEKIVIRLLHKEKVVFPLHQLGFNTEQLDQYHQLLKRSSGMVLVTGPTGCGKTTPLYSSLHYLNDPSKNMITIEDPVECHLPGINQVQVNEKTGMTFAKGLRSILRQDPDIIMIGEIRDLETANLAVRSSLTGHLVFSTLHTNSVLNTIKRLIDMGIQPYLVSSAIDGIIHQRLVRVICDQCKEAYKPPMKDFKLFKLYGEKCPPELYQGQGCHFCKKSGYRGRTAVSELLILNDSIKEALSKGFITSKIMTEVYTDVFSSLESNAFDKVRRGITTTDEIKRVLLIKERL